MTKGKGKMMVEKQYVPGGRPERVGSNGWREVYPPAGSPQPLADDPRGVVIHELHERLNGLVIPFPVQRFVVHVLGAWMLMRRRRYGESSAPWQEAKAYAAAFCDLLHPAVTPVERERKCSARSLMLAELSSRIERARLPAEESRTVLAGLELHFRGLNAREQIGLRGLPVGVCSDLSFLQEISG